MGGSKTLAHDTTQEWSEDGNAVLGGHDGLWIRFLTWARWYPKDMNHLEKRLVLKLDVLILTFGCLSFFTKYLDQQAITNAYVSGMKEDIGLVGNELNYITAAFWAAYCTSMIPACYYLTRSRINIILPTLEAGWGLFTFGCAWAQNPGTIYAMRVLIGICESCSFTGVIYVIGSWYKPEEIGRRISLFFIASPLGTMFAGYLQAAAYTNLNNTHGLAGWRYPSLKYLYENDYQLISFTGGFSSFAPSSQYPYVSCMPGLTTSDTGTLLTGDRGYIAFLDVPHRTKPRFLTHKEHELANSRLVGLTAPSQLKVSRDIFKRVLGRWHCCFYCSCLDRGDHGGQEEKFLAPFYHHYNSSPVGPCVACSLESMSPLTMSWATVTMANDAEERAIVTASMNAIGQAMSAWTQLLQYPAAEAPNFRGGFISNLATTVAQLAVVAIMVLLTRWDARKTRGSNVSAI
ncbi:permease of the major facilitator [Aspergillus oryzae 100-8]|uniref:Permease of the major facilitator superfamily n=1 Tax=Aspergillus oryzae (strain 3.042) TaxID=1160506 RepID=I8TEQ7_ASPO3|nr:permease of the major facilitator superfamily [Aspergillus oryzae 3.042]KDE83954.1 permease of the major facilitator [Aspergillus oryzae 100-8]|eukprot:EIT72480.1 permease of the major facilitator superfamily [Aspergillus oryzae 3.042]